MRFIEKSFPVEFINPIAMAEGNAKKAVYQMHKWWARRLGSVFRMIVLGALSDRTHSDEEICNKFRDGANLGGAVVLDPFMGGGTTIVEALRLGCKTIGIDINPVAWFTTKKEIEAVDLNELDRAFRRLEERAGNYIKEYYRTRCPNGHHADVMYFFWVKVAKCRSCGAAVRLFPNYELSRNDDIDVVVCPDCLQVLDTPARRTKVKCDD